MELDTNFTERDNRVLAGAGYTQPVFILGQTILFPGLGILGSLLASSCAMMPWLAYFRDSPKKAVSMLIAGLCLAPLYGLFCTYIVLTVQKLLG